MTIALLSLDFFSLEQLEALAQRYGYWTVFLGLLLENAGVPLPGESLTLVGGFLAGSGDLRLSGVVVSALGGSILGDNLGYWLGRWGGWQLVQWAGRMFRIPEDRLEQGREQFARNAIKAVLLGRFVTFLRIFAGPLAGIAAMPYGRFLVCNAVGALLWVSTIVGLAYGAGQLVPLAVLVQWVGQFGLLVLGLVAVWAGSVVWLRRSLPLMVEPIHGGEPTPPVPAPEPSETASSATASSATASPSSEPATGAATIVASESAVAPEATALGSSAEGSDPGAPDVTTPDVTTPDVTTPEVTAPEVTAPDVTTPEAIAPEVTTPDVTAPEVTAPEAIAPEVTTPEVATPEAMTLPETAPPVQADQQSEPESDLETV